MNQSSWWPLLGDRSEPLGTLLATAILFLNLASACSEVLRSIGLMVCWTGIFLAGHMDLCTRLLKGTFTLTVSCRNEQLFNIQLSYYSVYILMIASTSTLLFPICISTLNKCVWGFSFHRANLYRHQPCTPAGKKLRDKALCLASSAQLSWRQHASTLISLFRVPLTLSDPLSVKPL